MLTRQNGIDPPPQMTQAESGLYVPKAYTSHRDILDEASAIADEEWHKGKRRDEPEPDTPESKGYRTLAEVLAAADQDNQSWILPGYIARKGLTLLAAEAGCGKSYWYYALAKAAETGGEFIGRQITEPTDMVLLTEESGLELTEKAFAFGLQGDHYFITPADARGETWEDHVDEMVRFADPQTRALLIIDSFTAWACLKADEENDAGVISNRLMYLRRAVARANLAALILHHFGWNSKRLRGSTAFLAQCSVVINFSTGRHFTERKLEVPKARFRCTPSVLVIDFDFKTCQYRDIDGSLRPDTGAEQAAASVPATRAEATTVRDRIRQTYQKNQEAQPWTMKRARTIYDTEWPDGPVNENTFKKYHKQLVDGEEIERVRKKRPQTFRYSRAGKNR